MRPGMYIGDTGDPGLHHLVYEVVDNSIDEAMAGYCNRDPRDRPRRRLGVDRRRRPRHPGRHPPRVRHDTLEVVLTKLHAGGKFDHDTYKVSGGLHGVGVTVVNALSEWLEAEVHRDGQVWRQELPARGDPGAARAHRRHRPTRHQDPLPARRRDLRDHRLRLRHPGEAAARAGLPEPRDR